MEEKEGVYYVEGVGYCTGLAWAEENARGSCAVRNPDGSVKEPVFHEWEDQPLVFQASDEDQ